MGIRSKLITAVVGFVILVLLIAGMLVINEQKQIRLEEMEKRGKALLRSLAIPCAMALAKREIYNLDKYITQATAEYKEELEILYIMILDPNGKVLSHSDPKEYAKTYNDENTKKIISSDKSLINIVSNNYQKHVMEISMPIKSGLRWGTLKAGFDLSRIYKIINKHTVVMSSIIIFLVVITGGLIYLALSRIIIVPVLKLTRMADKLAGGELAYRVSIDGKDEMRSLANHFNDMADQIREYTHSLEEKVLERTKKLKQANDDLTLAKENLEEANIQLERLAITDGLTGLFNHRYFKETLDFEIKRSARSYHNLCLLMIDVDHFKSYNDTNGHPMGDELLRKLSLFFNENLRTTDVAARYGGEEFVILLLDTGIVKGTMTAEKIRAMVENYKFEGEESQPNGTVTICIGIAHFPDNTTCGDELVVKADKALYHAKRTGRNRVVSYGDIEDTKDNS